MLNYLKNVKFMPDASQLVRGVLVFLAGIAVAACAMALAGSHVASAVMGGVIVFTGIIMTYNVRRAMSDLSDQSARTSRAAAEAEQHYIMVLRKIITFVETRDGYTKGRSQRIGDLAEKIAAELGLDSHKCRMLNLAGQLHDIGMLAVPESVINRRGQLTTSEFRIVEKHADVSYELLKPLKSVQGVLGAIRHHHERMNGTGYPEGLQGRDIPTEARILAVADAYDAMTHDRPHRPAMSPYLAVKELRRCSPAGYDEDCVEALATAVNMPELEKVACPA